MDPITAALIIGMVVSTTSGMNAAAQQRNEQKRAQAAQEKLRVDSVRAEVGMQQQKSGLALGNAANRNKGTSMQPSFASAALTGNQSSNTPMAAGGSSGTF